MKRPRVKDWLTHIKTNCVAIDPVSGCWNWLNAKTPKGYGKVTYKYRTWIAHRLVWFLTKGKDSKHDLCHTCDNPACVNPDHVYEGDDITNTADKMNRKRQAKDKDLPQSKLREDQIRELRTEPRKLTFKELGRKYGLCTSGAYHVFHRNSYKHIR